MAKFLIIEDNKMLHKMYRRLFKEHDLEFVETGLGAMNLLKEGQYDLIISDGELEGPLTGADVWMWAKREKSELIEKFFFCSGNVDIAKFCEDFGIPYCDKGDTQPIKEMVSKMLEWR